MMDTENNQANQIIDRLLLVHNLLTDTALAAHLGINKQSISNWRVRNTPPFELCLKIANERNIDLNWLLKGHGSMYRNETKEDSPSYQTKSIHDLEVLFERVDTLEQQVSELKKQA